MSGYPVRPAMCRVFGAAVPWLVALLPVPVFADYDFVLARANTERGEFDIATPLHQKAANSFLRVSVPQMKGGRLGLVTANSEVRLDENANPQLQDKASRIDDLGLARVATDRREFDLALPRYRDLLAQRPDDADLLIEVARVHGYADLNAEAAALYSRVVSVEPTRRQDVLAALAWQSLWSGQADQAQQLFTELVDAGSDRADALDGLGQARQIVDNQAGALAAFREAVAIRSSQGKVHRRLRKRLAMSLLWNDLHDEAIAALQALSQDDPGDRSTAWALANAINFSGRHREALQAFSRVSASERPGERFDLARAYRWAGFDELAAPLLQDQTDREALWLRDWRVARELKANAHATFEYSVDRDRLTSRAQVLGGVWHPAPGEHVQVSLRHLSLDEPSAASQGEQLKVQYRWRLGTADNPGGTWWPSVAMTAHRFDGWSTLAPALRATWVPKDQWRFDGELVREIIETPKALANRVSVDVASIGVDHRPTPRWTYAGAMAALRFDDSNLRVRFNGRVDYALAMRPRWVVGLNGMRFNSSLPESADQPNRGYWNPKRYSEARVYTAVTHEQRPYDLYARVAFGASREIDGRGNASNGSPHVWELGLGWDLAPWLRMKLAAGGSGSGLGLGGGGDGYWRRYANLSLSGWF